ncbi:hypothetical protein [Candidatus Uabimicrobium amorphum]|uniref:Uncharacterized protein n=1 Tax=Uabimicrobium amorphum TaxID=2596890 RepID=A0A5S9IRE5_UABAM|nr:hypothetical protein [Candidatus Uabimicrobium amorphum]BBM86699.1 hypothetical protein UABAM_05085 [Candidatus Uabimicrobium amorphum]
MFLLRIYILFTATMLKMMVLIVLMALLCDMVRMIPAYATALTHGDFWEDANEYATGEQSLEQLTAKYGKNFTKIASGAFWMFLPSEKTITFHLTLATKSGGSITQILVLMIFFYILFRITISWYAKQCCCENDPFLLYHEYFYTTSIAHKLSILTSAIVVLVISYINASLETQYTHLSFHELVAVYFVLSYTSAIWFLVIKYIIDIQYIEQNRNPHDMYRDDVIAVILTIGILFFFSNSFLSILSEIIAGVLPFVLVKTIRFNVPNSKLLEEKDSLVYKYEEAMGMHSTIYREISLALIGVVILAVIIGQIFMADGLMWS